jgi:hypothetical protein
MANYLIDGPANVSIDGDRVTLRGTSDGTRLTVTLRLEDALITAHRLHEAHAARPVGSVIEVDFTPLPRGHADTA